MDRFELLSSGSSLLLLVTLILAAQTWRARKQLQRSRAHDQARGAQVQALRDAVHCWLDSDSSPTQLQDTITRITSLRTWWLDCSGDNLTEAQVAHAPFVVEAHLASMALHTQRTVHQHQLAQWAWASSYLPLRTQAHPHALLMLASDREWTAADHAFAVALAETLCNSWCLLDVHHAPAINPA